MYKIALALLLTSKAMAAPTIYPTFITELAKLTNNTKSNIVADNVDPKRVYVMPPSVASANVDGLHSITANVGFCREIADSQTYSRILLAKIKDLALQEAQSKDQADQMRKSLFQARTDAAKYAVQTRLQDLQTLDLKTDAMELRLTELYASADTCQKACDGINQEIDDLVKNKAVLLKERASMVKTHAKDIREYERYRSLIAGIQENLKDQDEAWSALNRRMMQIRGDFQNIYLTFSKMEGARAKISFKSEWDQNVTILRNENPGFEFEKIQTQNSMVMSNISTGSSLPSDGAVMSYEIAGFSSDGKMNFPAYPESIAGNVKLSLLGTCPVLHPGWFDITLPTGTDQMKYGLTVSYDYPTVFSVNAIAKYNMYKMYQKIISSSSSGGFFSSRSSSSVEERNFFKDSFNVTWDEQDPAFSFTDEQKAAIEAEMRRNIFDRVATLALSQQPDKGGLIKASTPSAHGSVVLADSLMQACPTNIYCVVGSIALNVLDSIFGSSSSAASYLQTFDIESSESFSRSKVIFKPAITSYQ